MSSTSTMDLAPHQRRPYLMPDKPCPHTDCKQRFLTDHGYLRHLELVHNEPTRRLPRTTTVRPRARLRRTRRPSK